MAKSKIINKIKTNAKVQALEIFEDLKMTNSYKKARSAERGTDSFRKVITKAKQNANAYKSHTGIDVKKYASEAAERIKKEDTLSNSLGNYIYGQRNAGYTQAELVNTAINSGGEITESTLRAYQADAIKKRTAGAARVTGNTIKDYYVNPFKEKKYRQAATRVGATALGIGATVGTVNALSNDDKQLY